MRLITTAILVASLLLSISSSPGHPSNENSDLSKPALSLSPNKAFEIKDIYLSSDKDSQRRHIYFRKVSHPKQWLALIIPSTGDNSYWHNVEILWSPDSTRFAITDVNPGLTDVYLYSVQDINHPVIVSKETGPELRHQVGAVNASMDSRQYLYISARRWLNANLLELNVDLAYAKQVRDLRGEELQRFQKDGSRASASYHWLYSWDLRGRFRKIRPLNDND